MAQPITEIIPITMEGQNLFLPFDARTLSNTDADRLFIGLATDGTNTPALTDIGFLSQHARTSVVA